MLRPPSCIIPPNRENSMSIENMAPDRVCYIQCSFCNTVLAVNVPSSTVCPTIVTVRCGHCANLLPINMAAALQPIPHQAQLQLQQPHKPNIGFEEGITKASGSSSKGKKFSSFESTEQDQPRMPPIRPPEKRQRVPSAYNRFIKEEIQRIKASNPDISHREAFSTAAKNWAHFPHIHFGLKLDNGSNKQAKLDHHHSFTSAASTDHHHNKSHAAGFY